MTVFRYCLYLPIDRETQRKRVWTRFVEAPDHTWPMSEEELTQWRARFDEPDEAELQGTMLEDAPHGYASWSAWAAMRWPTLPDEYA
jgi:polyphosphate kinase 2 (PPK2 family)